MALTFKSIQPVDYYKRFSDNNVRPDGRGLNEPRFAAINVGTITTADSSALVRLGNSSVLCGIKAELAMPKVDEPTKGFLIPNVDLSPICSSHFRPGPPGEQAQVTSQLIVEIIESSKLIDLQQLCIKEGKTVWVLYCDIVCLNCDGSILDASLISLTAALRSLKLPSVTVNPENDVPQVDLANTKDVEIRCNPTSVTFAIFENKILMDPTDEEELLSDGLITISLSDDGVCGILKAGGPAVEDVQVQECISQAQIRRKDILKMIDGALSIANT